MLVRLASPGIGREYFARAGMITLASFLSVRPGDDRANDWAARDASAGK